MDEPARVFYVVRKWWIYPLVSSFCRSSRLFYAPLFEAIVDSNQTAAIAGDATAGVRFPDFGMNCR